MMKTADVRIDPKLNQFIWNQGVRNLPRRVRVRISRKRTEDEGKGSEWYSLVQHINTEDFSGKLTEKAKVSAWLSSYLNNFVNPFCKRKMLLKVWQPTS